VRAAPPGERAVPHRLLASTGRRGSATAATCRAESCDRPIPTCADGAAHW
jgi:hypothetical protein